MLLECFRGYSDQWDFTECVSRWSWGSFWKEPVFTILTFKPGSQGQIISWFRSLGMHQKQNTVFVFMSGPVLKIRRLLFLILSSVNLLKVLGMTLLPREYRVLDKYS